MHTTRLRRTLALVTAAALLATMTAATIAAPASAAKPKCQGKVATIVGTQKGEVIRGTARRDVIVAKGGHDRIFGRGGNDLICAGTGNDTVYGGAGADTIWGQLGNDRLFGNAGNDFLAGQVGNDTLNGGINFDTCFQGTGMGLVTNCELPAPPLAPPPPPPEPPTLVIAYSDINHNQIYDTGDVMISKIVDTNGDGDISIGDTIKMGRYPTYPGAVAPAHVREPFEPWGVKTHTVTVVNATPANRVFVGSPSGVHVWSMYNGVSWDWYSESTSDESKVDDPFASGTFDEVLMETPSPSQPHGYLYQSGIGEGDDSFIDVIIY